MNLSVLVTMGITALGGMVVEKMLGKGGKIEEAGYVGMVTTSMLALTALGAAGKVFYAVLHMGK